MSSGGSSSTCWEAAAAPRLRHYATCPGSARDSDGCVTCTRTTWPRWAREHSRPSASVSGSFAPVAGTAARTTSAPSTAKSLTQVSWRSRSHNCIKFNLLYMKIGQAIQTSRSLFMWAKNEISVFSSFTLGSKKAFNITSPRCQVSSKQTDVVAADSQWSRQTAVCPGVYYYNWVSCLLQT